MLLAKYFICIPLVYCLAVLLVIVVVIFSEDFDRTKRLHFLYFFVFFLLGIHCINILFVRCVVCANATILLLLLLLFQDLLACGQYSNKHLNQRKNIYLVYIPCVFPDTYVRACVCARVCARESLFAMQSVNLCKNIAYKDVCAEIILFLTYR